MKIVFEDEYIIVIHKEPGEATQTSKGMSKDVVSMIKVHLAKNGVEKGEPYVGIIHRLDQPVEGLLVFAKNKECAASLSRQVQNDLMNKIYTATVEGLFGGKSQETLVDYIYKDNKENKAVIVCKEDITNCIDKHKVNDIKKAELSYEVLSEDKASNTSVLRVRLKTGRFHQIRAQLSNIGHPIIGDVKYGGRKTSGPGIGLAASRLEFIHPKDKKKMHFEINCSE